MDSILIEIIHDIQFYLCDVSELNKLKIAWPLVYGYPDYKSIKIYRQYLIFEVVTRHYMTKLMLLLLQHQSDLRPVFTDQRMFDQSINSA